MFFARVLFGVALCLSAHAAQELSIREIDGVKLHLQITDSARAIIADKNFDLPDNEFSQEAFDSFILSKFTDSLNYFRKVTSTLAVDEFFVVIDDLKDRRKDTISETGYMTRVITADVRRWHKLYRGKSAFLADLTSIHEFTHVANYVLDPAEVKMHRELAGIVFEALNLMRLYGKDSFQKSYLKKTTGPLAKRESVLGDEYKGNAPLRYLVHAFFKRVLDGTYAVAGAPVAALERFATAYLSDKATGAEGFDSAAAKVGIGDQSGAKLNFKHLQSDLYAELSAG